MSHYVPVVVPDGPDVRKYPVDVPPVLQKMPVDTAPYFLVLTTFPSFLKGIVDSQHVHLQQFLEGVDLEGGFKHEIAQFSPLHRVEESHIPVRRDEVGFVDQYIPQFLEETSLCVFVGHCKFLIQVWFVMVQVLIFLADVFLQLKVLPPLLEN